MTSKADSSSPTTPDAMSDFTVLHRDTSISSHSEEETTVGLDRVAMARLEKQRGQAIARVCGLLCENRESRPLRIVLLGKHGSGKSSFVNSVAAAFSEDSWHEYAYTGFHGGAEPITIFTQKYEKCCNGKRKRYRDVPLPTLIDVAGKMDIGDDKMEELLRLIFYGHIEEDSAIMEAYEFCERHTRDEIREKYSTAYPDMKVDRVVFIASAADSDKIPEKLIDCVKRAARPEHFKGVKRTIPLFGVLTKKDKVNNPEGSEFLEKKETYMRALGLQSNRFLCCSNYCDDTDPNSKRTSHTDPRLDLPIVEFFYSLSDPALKVIQDDEELPSGGPAKIGEKTKGKAGDAVQKYKGPVQQFQTFWNDLGPTGRAVVTSVIVIVAMWIVLYVLLVYQASGSFEATVREACNKGTIKDQAILDACRASPPASPVYGTTLVALVAGILTFFFMTLKP